MVEINPIKNSISVITPIVCLDVAGSNYGKVVDNSEFLVVSSKELLVEDIPEMPKCGI